MKRKIAFSLPGGGARGITQVAYLTALEEFGIEPDVMRCTSVGSLNGPVFALHGSEKLRKIWLEEIQSRDDILEKVFLGGIRTNHLYRTTPLKKIINRIMTKMINGIDVRVTTVDWMTGELLYIRHDDPEFKDAMLASSSIPIFMDPVLDEDIKIIEKKHPKLGRTIRSRTVKAAYYDGGLRELAPIRNILRDHPDVTDIYVLMTKPETVKMEKVNEFDQGWFSSFTVLKRVIDIMTNEIYRNDICLCQERYPGVNVLAMAPEQETGIDTLEFNPVKFQKVFDQELENARQILADNIDN